MSLPEPVTDPKLNHVLIVAVETYLGTGPAIDLDLNGPVHDAVAWVNWLVDECRVPPGNIAVLASPVEANRPLLNLLAEREIACYDRPHFGNDVFQEVLGRFQQKPGRLWLAWSGHGLWGPDGSRYALLGNYTYGRQTVIRLADLLNRLRSAAGGFPPEQVLAFDTCATRYDDYERLGRLVYEIHDALSSRACRQLAMFASEDRTPALNREGVGGLFTRELLHALREGDGAGSPRLGDLDTKLRRRFDELRQQTATSLRPVHYTWRPSNGPGDEDVVLIPRLGPQHDPAPFLRAVAAEMARSPFPWPLPRQGMEFFRDLHIKVRVGPRRRDPLRDLEQERRHGAGAVVNLPVARKTAESAYRPSADESRFKEQQVNPPQPWFDTIAGGWSARERFPWAVLLGDPGLGKTTLLRHEGWLTAREGLTAIENGSARPENLVVPIYARLAALARGAQRDQKDNEICDALAHEGAEAARGSGYDQEEVRNWLKKKLNAGQVVLLFDALDELTEAEHDSLVPRLDGWVRDHPPRRLYITSRQAGYRSLPPTLKGGAGSELELVAFTPKEVQSYVAAYFGDNNPRADALRAQLAAKPGILGLAQIPLFSSLICLAFSEGPADAPWALPDTRSGLIARCLDVLLARWGRVRRVGYDPEEPAGEVKRLRAQRDLLAKLARELTGDDPEHTLFTEVEVTSALARASAGAASNPFGLDAVAAIDALARQAGILTRSGRPREARYLFLHRTFQEFLLAWSIACRGDWRDHLSRHLYDPAWHEPLAMIGGAWSQLAVEQPTAQDIAAEARNCVEWLLHQNEADLLCRPFLLACDVVAEGDIMPETIKNGIADIIVTHALGYSGGWVIDKSKVFRDHLIRQGLVAVTPLLRALRKREVSVRERAAEMLRGFDVDPRIIDAVRAALPDEKVSIYNAAAVEALGALGRADPPVIDALLAALRDKEVPVREGAGAAALKAPGRADVFVIESLRYIDDLPADLREKKASVRGSAAAALGALGRADQPVIDALLGALRDEDSSVRGSAAAALGALGRPDPPVVDALRAALRDESGYVCVSAAEALGALGRADPPVTDTLRTALRNFGYVGARAARALGALGRADPRIIDVLLGALRDEDSSVRGSAAAALGALGRADQPVIDALLGALRDEDSSVRGSAAAALGALGRPDPPVVDALRAALRDESGYVCVSAAEALGALGRPDPPVIDALLTIIHSEPLSSRLSDKAVKALGELGRADPPVIDALLFNLRNGLQSSRVIVAAALGALGRPDPPVVDALLAALHPEKVSEPWPLCWKASESLLRIGALANRPLPPKRAPTISQELHKAWNRQLLSLVSRPAPRPSTPWWQRLWR